MAFARFSVRKARSIWAGVSALAVFLIGFASLLVATTPRVFSVKDAEGADVAHADVPYAQPYYQATYYAQADYGCGCGDGGCGDGDGDGDGDDGGAI